MSDALPIEGLRDDFAAAVIRGPVVVSAPTGSGKSTRVPVWCREITGRPVLVVEPRRVACRALAQRVAHLDGSRLGTAVGYSVRDDHRARPDSGILFATPGVVLRMLADDPALRAFGTVILDEFHERSLDVDLLMALLEERSTGALVVMSATLDGERIAAHLGGRHLEGEGRLFPVEVRYLGRLREMPTDRGLTQRVQDAVGASRSEPGDVLVFLPGKAEIAAAAQALGDEDHLVTLHGGLSIDEQAAAFASASRRKVILSTNVAETSVTVPGVGVVIDSGLVRRTRYHRGRGFLTLAGIARDSAEQRSGRAGRTAPGICYRLWSEGAPLEPSTPPEIYRDALVPLVLAAAAAGTTVDRLRFLDPPRDHAVESARGELEILGILTPEGSLTARGRAVFHLPLDAALGRLLVEAEQQDNLPDMIDLVAVLSVGRRLFRGGVPRDEGDDSLRAGGCDATAAILAVRRGEVARDGLDAFTLEEARRARRRLRSGWELEPEGDRARPVDRQGVVRTVLAADPRSAHVARRRKRRIAWSNGGTELELARESTVPIEGKDAAQAVLVLDTIALGQGARETRLLATCAMPVTLAELARAGLGRDRLGKLKLRDGLPACTLERVYAGRVLSKREDMPEGPLAREAIRDLFLRGQIFPGGSEDARDRLEAMTLHARLGSEPSPPPLEDWLLVRLEALGVETGRDLELLTREDLLPSQLPDAVQERLDKDYPRTLCVGAARYRITYDLARYEVILEGEGGIRRDPPSTTFLPAFKGLRVLWKDRSRQLVLRERR